MTMLGNGFRWDMRRLVSKETNSQGRSYVERCTQMGCLKFLMYSPMHKHTTFSVILGRRFVPTF